MDRAFGGSTWLISLLLIGLLVALLVVLLDGSWRVFSRFGFGFFTGTTWDPVPGREKFGALPFVFGTLVTSAVAIVIAVPVSVGVAILLNEVRRSIANPLAIFVDILAAIPSVVYGLWGLYVLKPFFDDHVEPFLISSVGRVPLLGALFHGKAQGPDMFTAGVILAIMILPIVTAVTREVIAVVPRDLREAALALGSTRWEATRLAVLPYARSGVVGATMLGLGRALGETIAVTMVIGNTTQIKASLMDPAATIPSKIAAAFREASSVGLHHSALLGLAVTLVVMAFILALLSRLLVRRTSGLVGGPTAEEAASEAAWRISG